MESVTEEIRVALETERKFEFYFIGAIFTILGLAVQTAQVYTEASRNILSVGGFLFLAVSAICAFIALSRLVRRNWVIADMQDWEASLQALHGARAESILRVSVDDQAEEVAVDNEITRLARRVTTEEAKAATMRNVILVSRELRNWAFLLGLALILLARTWPIILSALDVVF
jgi:hypothetical protein